MKLLPGIYDCDTGKLLLDEEKLHEYHIIDDCFYMYPNKAYTIEKEVEVILPDHIKVIEAYNEEAPETFQNVSLNEKIRKIHIHKNIISIKNTAFEDTILKEVIFEEDRKDCLTIGSFAFKNTNIETLKIPENINIESYAFEDNHKLLSVTISGNSSILCSYIFKDCNHLESANIFIKEIPYGMFSGCKELKQVEMPQTEIIEDSAFRKCTSLKTLTCPSVKTIAGSPFAFSGLESIVFEKQVDLKQLPFKDTAFFRCEQLKTIEFYDSFKCYPSSNPFYIDSIEHIYTLNVSDKSYENCAYIKDLKDRGILKPFTLDFLLEKGATMLEANQVLSKTKEEVDER